MNKMTKKKLPPKIIYTPDVSKMSWREFQDTIKWARERIGYEETQQKG